MARSALQPPVWIARENHQGKDGICLIVSGAVDVTNTNQAPVLTAASPQGSDPRVLVLDLCIEPKGPGMALKTRRHGRFDKKVSADQYSTVVIRRDGKQIATVRVDDDRETARHLHRATEAANAKHPAPSRS